KVKVSGGGRCNCTNTFRAVGDLKEVYPRGHRLMKRLMKGFSHEDAWQWWERHGVRLTAQEDECVFPQAQDSHAIIDCLVSNAHRLGINILTGRGVSDISDLAGYDFIAVTTGGSPQAAAYEWLARIGHEIVPPIPSLFTFCIGDEPLHALMGLVTEARLHIPGTDFSASGALLITHWGLSGPAALRLSSYAARHLAGSGYRSPVAINWSGMTVEEVAQRIKAVATSERNALVTNARAIDVPSRLWRHIVMRALGDRKESGKSEATRALSDKAESLRWLDLSKKQLNRLIETITNDVYPITSRAAFKEEFVTCGGVSLSSVNAATLESRHHPTLFFAGEVLYIDGITGGFNFQAAWTTAHTVAQAIAGRAAKEINP
ncbi:MAG: aminoacetone oxidase family FAD-binding enzyme, partial [Oscillospiraceae bacterium]|nr:aminoacetone oxidase family FAD-binding enzyme [Oscillospiraceae bacterium]